MCPSAQPWVLSSEPWSVSSVNSQGPYLSYRGARHTGGSRVGQWILKCPQKMEIMKGAQPPPRPEGQLPTRGGVLSRERLWVQHTDLTKGRKEGCAESSGRSRAQSKSHQGGLPAGGCKVLLGEAKGTGRAQPYPGHVQDSPCRVHPELSLTSPHIPPESPQRPQEVEILAPKSERRSKLLP